MVDTKNPLVLTKVIVAEDMRMKGGGGGVRPGSPQPTVRMK